MSEMGVCALYAALRQHTLTPYYPPPATHNNTPKAVIRHTRQFCFIARALVKTLVETRVCKLHFSLDLRLSRHLELLQTFTVVT
ncbi:hypothetical protein J6590_039305 [Homalodisca vitripennis]|nr:hypothetical protein J6590_039305 [Homalodisca vitripennis]